MTASARVSFRVLLASLALALAGCAANETAGEAIDDAALTARIKAAFVADSKVSALNIRVDSDRGEVHLSGVARDSDEMQQAVRLARDVRGVRNVRNDIVVR